MPIKPYYSLEASEAIVAEEIKRRYPNLHIFIPEKDIGVDLIVLGDLSRPARYPITIQVKESRYYRKSHWHYAWHHVGKSKLENMAEMVDFYVFVTYVDVPESNKIGFRKEFIVIPTRKLLEACKDKKEDSEGVYNFGFSFQYDEGHTRVLDVRDIWEPYSFRLPAGYNVRDKKEAYWDKAPNHLPYHNNWKQLVEALEEQEDIRAGLLALNDPDSTSWDEYKELRAKGG